MFVTRIPHRIWMQAKQQHMRERGIKKASEGYTLFNKFKAWCKESPLNLILAIVFYPITIIYLFIILVIDAFTW